MSAVARRRTAGWVGVAGLEAAGRLLIQVGVTAALARMLSPDDFGLSAMVLSAAAILAVVAGGMPFEEALAQRKVARRAHFETALGVSWAAGAGGVLLALALGGPIGAAFDAPDFAGLLAVACALAFAHAPWSILTALARRRRRFNDVAVASLLGHLLGAAAALAIGLAGGGVWALVCFRIVVVFGSAAALSSRLGVVLTPRWSQRRLREIAAFSRVSLGERLIENATYLLFNYAVGAFFGLQALGHLNMALRIVEPLRGAVVGISHNIAFPFLRSAVAQPAALAGRTLDAMQITTLAAAPAFLGLGAVSPILIPLMAGPGWSEAVVTAGLLAMGSSLMTPTQIALTATNALGEPRHNLARRAIGLGVTAVALALAAPLGPLAAGAARLAGDAAEAAWALRVAHRRLGASSSALARRIGLPWALAAAMAGCVLTSVTAAEGRLPPAAALALAVALGATLYAAASALLVPQAAAALRGWRARPAAQ